MAQGIGIGAMAARFGVSHRTLRFYEQIDLLHPRRIGNRRLYTPSDVVLMTRIAELKAAGLALEHIRQLLAPGTIDRQRLARLLDASRAETLRNLAALQARLATIDATLAALRAA